MWQIIGAGAIGCLWAANLKKNGQAVHLITRSHLSANPEQLPILHYQDLQQQHHDIALSCSHTLLNADDPILMCVKATQVKQAIQEQLPNIGKQQVIILMHNGMGCAEQVQALLPNNPIICATTANASLLHSPLTIEHTGKGATYLGAFNAPAKQYNALAEKLNGALDHTRWTDNIKQKLWLKIIINSSINPLTALHQIKNGQLQAAVFKETLANICQECVQIAKAEQVYFQESELLETIHQVIIATAENYSSMNRDLFFHRKTENEYINGYLLQKAQQHNISAPCISDLYQKIQHAQHYC